MVFSPSKLQNRFESISPTKLRPAYIDILTPLMFRCNDEASPAYFKRPGLMIRKNDSIFPPKKNEKTEENLKATPGRQKSF